MATATSTDQLAFLRAIAAHPDEDTARVVYADWLDENGDPARAEFVRVQCELARFDWRKCGGYYCETYDTGNTAHRGCRGDLLRDRESALRAAHEHDWQKGPVCGTCGGSGEDPLIRNTTPPREVKCSTCHGTGDGGGLMRRTMRDNEHDKGGHEEWLYPVHFDRGFITRVTVPTLAELVAEERVECKRCEGCSVGKLLRCPDCDNRGYTLRTVPSALLRGIVGRVEGSPPERMLVAEVAPGDRVPQRYPPFESHGTPLVFGWLCAHRPEERFSIPAPVWNALDRTGYPDREVWADYATEAEAVSALGRALAQWGRV